MSYCDVYWGSHGCCLERGHDGPHECDCCRCGSSIIGEHDERSLDLFGCVAKPPYYGPDTRFYGDDA